MSRSARTRVGVAAGRLAGWLSRVTGRGARATISGRVLNVLAPGALAELATGKRTALVSATNGKTTTTRFLAAALATDGRTVTTNSTGANLTSGIAPTLARAPDADTAVLEVDERVLPRVVDPLAAELLVLGNLSRDQLDRYGEVHLVADAWRAVTEEHPKLAVVANASDPHVVWAASPADVIAALSDFEPIQFPSPGSQPRNLTTSFAGEILGAVGGPAVILIGIHSGFEAALRPARAAIAGETGIGDCLPRSRPTFAAWSNVPSGWASRQLDIPTSGRSRMTASMWSRAPAYTSVSGLSTSTNGAVELRSTMLFATQKPEFQSSACRATSGNSSRPTRVATSRQRRLRTIWTGSNGAPATPLKGSSWSGTPSRAANSCCVSRARRRRSRTGGEPTVSSGAAAGITGTSGNSPPSRNSTIRPSAFNRRRCMIDSPRNESRPCALRSA